MEPEEDVIGCVAYAPVPVLGMVGNHGIRLVSGRWVAVLLFAHVAFLRLCLEPSRGLVHFFDGMPLLYHGNNRKELRR